jgi:RNA polymerase sigma factor (sigma-70 family)
MIDAIATPDAPEANLEPLGPDDLTPHMLALKSNTDPVAVAQAIERITRAILVGICREFVSHWKRRIEYDDAMQLSIERVLHSSKLYDARRAARPYIITVVRRALITEVLSTNAKKRIVNYIAFRDSDSDMVKNKHTGMTLYHISNKEILPDTRHENPAKQAEQRELAQLAVAALKETLTPFEYDCFISTQVHGERYDEVATRLGRKLKSIDNAIGRAKQKLSLIFDEDDEQHGIRRKVFDHIIKRQRLTIKARFVSLADWLSD